MDSCAKAGLSFPELVNFFLRIQKSIEDTAQRIFREMYPNPMDDGLNSKGKLNFREAKLKRDEVFKQFLKESRF